ncbi:MAG TPA: beta-ketoacyl-[acyl-carrier-protein] synthase family protein, partial [Pseudonocardiaceae bacterium]
MAPGGVGVKEFWSLLTEGRTATRRITFFDPSRFRSQVAAEVDFDPEAHGLRQQEIRRMDRAIQMAVIATREALADSGYDVTDGDPHRTGVCLGSALGATTGLEEEYRVLSDDGRLSLVDHRYAVPQLFDYFIPSSFAAEIGWTVGAEGPTTLVSTGCTSGIDSVGYACDLIREGSADVMIAGATDAPISPISMAAFDAIKATTPSNDDPEHASRPFDARRNGFVLGEGAAMFVLEDMDHARSRGAPVHAEIAGYASRCNAFHMTGLRPDGREMAEAIRVALEEARLPGDSVDYINAHGSGTKQNDRHETA